MDFPAAEVPAAGLYQRLSDMTEATFGRDAASPSELSALLHSVNRELLSAALKTEANITQRKRVLRRIADAAQPSALLLATRSAADAYERPLSPVLDALLAKLAREADELPQPVRVAADHAFRDLVKDIVDAWSARSLDSVSTGYDSLFADPAEQPATNGGSVAPEPERVLDLAFESGATGSVVWAALARVTESQHGVRRVLDMIKRAPSNSHAATVVAQQFANPARLSSLLHEEPVDFEAVDALLAHMGNGAAPALLDALAEAKSRATRRGLLDRLAAVGPSVSPLVSERLKSDQRWYVQRNMLTLLREAGCPLDEVPLDKYTTHADARVRREVTQLMFQKPLDRERALAAALRDQDVEMLKIGLKAARASLPESVVPLLASRVVAPEFPPEFRTSAIQLLARSSSVLALEALLRFVSGGTTLWGKPKLAPKSPEMLIALSGLARSWPNERRASVLLAIARDSKDQDIAKAAIASARVVAEEKDVLDDD